MTEIAIAANAARKTLKVTGRAAAGERVRVTLKGLAGCGSPTLRLRVACGRETVAAFPLSAGDAWERSGDDLAGEMSLCTAQAKRLCSRGACVLWVLEDTAVPQLYGAAEGDLLPWLVEGAEVGGGLPDDIGGTEEGGALAAHLKAVNNPHFVTAAQVGLGRVDNTPDAEKPVSAAQASAIAASAAGVAAQVTTESTRAANAEAAIEAKADGALARLDAVKGVAEPKAALASLKSCVVEILQALKGGS